MKNFSLVETIAVYSIIASITCEILAIALFKTVNVIYVSELFYLGRDLMYAGMVFAAIIIICFIKIIYDIFHW